MILVSNDRFFVNGIQLLASEYRSLNDPELMILDFSPFIYIINAKWYYRQRFESPLRPYSIVINSYILKV